MTRREIPPPLELECLKALWKLGEANVKDVRKAVCGNRPLAYTTVMTVLERLVKRGGIVRRKIGRSFIYSPVFSRDALRRHAVKELLDNFFDGSQDALIAYLDRRRSPELIALASAASNGEAEPHLDASLL